MVNGSCAIENKQMTMSEEFFYCEFLIFFYSQQQKLLEMENMAQSPFNWGLQIVHVILDQMTCFKHKTHTKEKYL